MPKEPLGSWKFVPVSRMTEPLPSVTPPLAGGAVVVVVEPVPASALTPKRIDSTALSKPMLARSATPVVRTCDLPVQPGPVQILIGAPDSLSDEATSGRATFSQPVLPVSCSGLLSAKFALSNSVTVVSPDGEVVPEPEPVVEPVLGRPPGGRALLPCGVTPNQVPPTFSPLVSPGFLSPLNR